MLSRIKANIKNIPGWKTDRKIVVIESDDWGATRIPSLESRDRAQAAGAEFGLGLGFDDFDTLESADDLSLLLEVLCRHKDSKGNPPIITANSVVANPDFERIKASQFTEYHFNPITETYKDNTLELIREGMQGKVFHPQYHGREHLNVLRWLESLRNNWDGSRAAFDEGIWSNTSQKMTSGHCMAAYDYATVGEKEFVLNSIIQGMSLFESIFGYRSFSTIAPCFIWSDDVTRTFVEQGVGCFQSGTHQKFPYMEQLQTNKKRRFRYTGQRGRFGEIYLQRNCSYEPASDGIYSMASTLRDIKRAFIWKKPAIIQSHRINFVGGLVKKNRDTNLLLLDRLLGEITRQFPQVEFMTSDELALIIAKNHQSNRK